MQRRGPARRRRRHAAAGRSSRACSASTPPTSARVGQRQGHDRQHVDLRAAAGDHATLAAGDPAPGPFDDQFAPPDVVPVARPRLASGPASPGTPQASLDFRVSLARGEVRPVPPAGNEYFNARHLPIGSPGPKATSEREQRYRDNMASLQRRAGRRSASPVGYCDAGHDTTNAAAQTRSSTPTPAPTGTAPRSRRERLPGEPAADDDRGGRSAIYLRQQGRSIPERRYVIRNLVGFFVEQARRDSVTGVSVQCRQPPQANGRQSERRRRSCKRRHSSKTVALVR